MESTLKKESDFYDLHKDEYINKYLGKKVLIYKQKLWGAFDTNLQALQFAKSNSFAPNMFMIKKVTQKEPSMRVCGMWNK